MTVLGFFSQENLTRFSTDVLDLYMLFVVYCEQLLHTIFKHDSCNTNTNLPPLLLIFNNL